MPAQRGDVAMSIYPNDRTVLYVKRVAALPGDHVQPRGGKWLVNGAPLLPGHVVSGKSAS